MIIKTRRLLLPLLFLAILAVIIFIPMNTINASNATDSNYSFESYKTEIDLKEDKTMDITETMQIHYARSGVNVGVIRDIQRISKTRRVSSQEVKDGKKYIALISNVAVTIDENAGYFELDTYDQGNFHSVLIGRDNNYLAAGTHEIVLKYTYDMSDDMESGFDDFTFDIYGYAMKPTKKFEATIHFPKPITKDMISMRTNYYVDPRIDFAISANTLHIEKTNVTGMTIQAVMDKGYFRNNGTAFFWYYIIFAVIAAIAIIISILFFFKNKKKPPTITKKVYPPANLTVLEAALHLNGRITSKDLALLILKWQNEGYLSLQENDHNKYYTIRKCKNLNSASILDRAYFNALFKESDTFYTDSSQNENLPTRIALNNVGNQIISETNRSLPDTHGPKRSVFALLTCLPFISIFAYFATLNSNFIILFTCIFTIAGTITGHALFKTNKVLSIIIYLMFNLPAIFVSIFILYIPQYDYAGLFYATILFSLCGFVFCGKIGVRSKQSQKIYSDLMSIMHFLLNIPKEEMETFLEKDKDYLGIMLPFFAALKMNKKLAKQLKMLQVRPVLYQSSLPYYISTRRIMRNCYRGSVYYAPPSNSGRSSYGGGGGRGGSSGGGGGGGGSRGR